MRSEDVAEPLTAEGESGEKPAEEKPKAARAPRFRPGPGPLSSARAMSVSGPHPGVPLDREVEVIDRALHEHGSANRRELGRRVGARCWGPGRFQAALRQAVAEGRAKRLPRGQFAPSSGSSS